MLPVPNLLILLMLLYACQPSGGKASATEPVVVRTADSLPPMVEYEALTFERKELLTAAPGTKSVLFNAAGTRLYAMNLEGMSVYEFDQASRRILREFRFTPTRGMGWDYNKSRPIASYQEKPVEGCLSHGDRILWVSLHNADGIVPIRLDSTGTGGPENADRSKSKPLTILYPGSDRRDSVRVPLILTGKTPKVIARTSDSHHLLVSNWHSRSVSVLQLNPDSYPYASLVSDVPVSAIPRGIAVDDRRGRSYVAIMGGSTMATIDHRTWKSDTVYPVSSSPRHVVLDSLGRLFVSYNSLGQVACLDAATGKTLFTAATHAQPRTIVLSKNQRFLFATCYSSDHLDVFKVHADRFEKVASLPCAGHPVGVDIFEDRDKLEAWVCSYSNGAIQVYTFKKSNPLK